MEYKTHWMQFIRSSEYAAPLTTEINNLVANIYLRTTSQTSKHSYNHNVDIIIFVDHS